MNKIVVFLLLAACLVILTACGSSPSDSGSSLSLQSYQGGIANLSEYGYSPPAAGSGGMGRAGYGPMFSMPAGQFSYPMLPMGQATGMGIAGGSAQPAAQGGGASLATVSVEVESVDGATSQVQAIAESLGGFVERLSGSGGSAGTRSDILLKVPQEQFPAAMERIEALGAVQFRSLGSEDVTNQHIDLTARLSIARKEEQSLLSLLERSDSVSELLSVERELARVRTNVEIAQSQLDLLEQRVALATIHVALFPQGTASAGAPAASFEVDVSNVSHRVAELRQYVAERRGEIDQVYLSSLEEEERAEVVFRVFSRDFSRTTGFIEEQGKVEARELLERLNDASDAVAGDQRPNARFQVAYVDRPGGVSFWIPLLVVVILAAMGGAATWLVRLAYLRGRQRGRFF